MPPPLALLARAPASGAPRAPRGPAAAARAAHPCVAFRGAWHPRTRWVGARAGKVDRSAEKGMEFVADGGGFEGTCEIETIKEAVKQCEGLEGKALEACYAEYGCDLKKVTDHYAKVAGLGKDEKDGK